jgi:hypothetical protein
MMARVGARAASLRMVGAIDGVRAMWPRRCPRPARKPRHGAGEGGDRSESAGSGTRRSRRQRDVGGLASRLVHGVYGRPRCSGGSVGGRSAWWDHGACLRSAPSEPLTEISGSRRWGRGQPSRPLVHPEQVRSGRPDCTRVQVSAPESTGAMTSSIGATEGWRATDGYPRDLPAVRYLEHPVPHLNRSGCLQRPRVIWLSVGWTHLPVSIPSATHVMASGARHRGPTY